MKGATQLFCSSVVIAPLQTTFHHLMCLLMAVLPKEHSYLDGPLIELAPDLLMALKNKKAVKNYMR